jgi:hypothetical protein
MSAYQNPPIQRHVALAPLSRDHYAGLVQAQHLIKAGDVNHSDAIARRAAVASFLDVWAHEIAPHFADEELLLLEFMSPADRQRLLDDHARIHQQAKQLHDQRKQVDPDPATLVQLGTDLDAHIRWEERELFNDLQQSLIPDQLARLQVQTEVLEATRPRHISKG